MSHNLHLFHVMAEDAEDACSAVETEIEDWGNENNWRTVEGALGKDGTYTMHEDHWRSSWYNDIELKTFEQIEENIRKDKGDIWDEEGTKELMQRALAEESLTGIEWYKIQDYAKERGDTFDNDKFSLALWNTYREYDYDEFGVTNVNEPEEGQETNLKEFIVFLDMHS